MSPGVTEALFNWLVLSTLEELASSGHPGRGARATGPWEVVSRATGPLRRQAGARHGGEEDASQIRAGRYSQVKHQEHEARRLVGIDESDWERGRKGRDTRWEGAGAS